MTGKQAIHDLEVIKEDFIMKTRGASPMCLDYAIEAIRKFQWIPVTYRPMTEEEEKEFCVKWGVKEGSLEDWEKRVFTCPLPDDGQEILISHGKYVSEDICSWDEDCCGLEEYGDWDGVDAWMPKPEPYKKGGAE